jgi:hypothetical protein
MHGQDVVGGGCTTFARGLPGCQSRLLRFGTNRRLGTGHPREREPGDRVPGPLGKSGNSVKGRLAATFLARELGLDLFASEHTTL